MEPFSEQFLKVKIFLSVNNFFLCDRKIPWILKVLHGTIDANEVVMLLFIFKSVQYVVPAGLFHLSLEQNMTEKCI